MKPQYESNPGDRNYHFGEPCMTIIEAKEISKTYYIGDNQIPVLDRVSFAVPHGEFIVVEGDSGSGKSTLISILSGLDKPSEGRVFIEGKDITDMREDQLAPLRNEMIGFVFQSFHLVPSLNALENVMFPAELKRDPEAREKAETLLKQIGLQGRRTNFPHQLSGGEKQRVAICRALINEPRIVFADEPTGNLDSNNGKAILELLLELQKERRTTLVLVTHSKEIAKMADRIILLQDGKIGADRKNDS
jgi:putative ABC transport system ATP-binding protein